MDEVEGATGGADPAEKQERVRCTTRDADAMRGRTLSGLPWWLEPRTVAGGLCVPVDLLVNLLADQPAHMHPQAYSIFVYFPGARIKWTTCVLRITL